uniref:Pre-mRNA-processing factor 39 n=1 Tax=Phallusia mammillata TaxID=59560 RepID=A0A6F9DPY0_9ASCI|nr:pre-mRNA-processing factor 39-like [Phallusia mammillata]
MEEQTPTEEPTAEQDSPEEIQPMEQQTFEDAQKCISEAKEETTKESDSVDDMQTDSKPAEQMEEKVSEETNDVEMDTNETVESKNSQEPEGPTAVEDGAVSNVDLTDNNDEKPEKDSDTTEAKIDKVLYEPKFVDYDDENVLIEIDHEFDNESEVVEGDESADFLKYWRTVSDSPHDFTSWTYLLQLVEQDGKMHLGRRAYNGFFKRYPLCYGYWKKFSEFERKQGNLPRAQKILERGVRAIPLSIDLWVHVIDFYTNHYKGLDAGKDKVRSVYDRAIKSAGEEFRSEKLWNKYIQWELVNNDWKAVVKIYDRAIKTQTQHYSIFFNDFKEFINTHAPEDWLEADEYKQRLAQVREAAAAEEKQADSKSDEDDTPPGDDDKPATDEEMKNIRLAVIKEKKEAYDETEQAVTKIWAFEEGIKRPYFHVKQLERAQLKNWREYLDSEINREEDNHQRVRLLFERCLIACALYEDFWLKYAKYMNKFDPDQARAVYKRACETHLPKKPNIHMQWAAHEELNGNTTEAARILEQLDNTLPGMAMIKMRRVAVARRTGDIKKAEDLMRAYVASAAKDKEEVFYTRKLAWFLFKIAGKKAEARKLMKDLIPKYKGDVRLYNDLVEMEFQSAGGPDVPTEEVEQLAMEAFDIALRSEKLTDDQKHSFSQRKVEFLEDYGSDVKRLQKAYDEHQKFLRNQKKRAQSEGLDTNPAKKAKTESSISVVGSASAPVANGTQYSSASTVSAAASYMNSAAQQAGAQQAGYTDPNMYYQQNYWNYQQKPADGTTAAGQYNYNQQWSQYYASQQQQQQ